MTQPAGTKAASTYTDVWSVYDELVAAGKLPDRGGHYDAETTQRSQERLRLGETVYLFPDATDADAIADDITTAFEEHRRRQRVAVGT